MTIIYCSTSKISLSISPLDLRCPFFAESLHQKALVHIESPCILKAIVSYKLYLSYQSGLCCPGLVEQLLDEVHARYVCLTAFPPI
jgi:hypothetical protein